MFRFTKYGDISGSGSPNYLKGGYDVTLETVSSVKYALITSFLDNRVVIINVNDPSAPSYVSSLAINKPAKVRTFDDGINVYAVVTSYQDAEVSVIDITTPASPSEVGTISGAGTPNYLDGAYGLCLAEIGSNWYAFVTSINDNKLVIIDLGTPASPSLVAAIGGPGTPNYCDGCHDVYVAEIASNWYAFVVSQDDNSLSVFDVDTPGSPSLSGSIQTINGAHSICGSGNYVYISACDNEALKAVDVSTPASPSVVGTVSGMGKPMGVFYKELSSKKFVFIADFLDDTIRAINVDDPASPVKVGNLSGEGSPNYLDGIHSLIADDNYAYAVSYNDNALAIFETDPSYSAWSATITIESDITCEVTKSRPRLFSANIQIESDITCEVSGGAGESDWGIGKPYWNPARRAYMQNSDGDWIDITHKVAEFGNINWQIEEDYHFNVFTANNMSIVLKNEDEEFDVDKADNYFVSIGQPQSGYRVPIRISCGYIIDGVESLVNVFHGLIVDIDTSSDDDRANVDLQCISRKLRDAKCDIGDEWEDIRLYGGDTIQRLRWQISDEKEGTVQGDVVRGRGEFPPSGYFQIDDEIIYFGLNTGSELTYCVRGCMETTATAHNRYNSDGSTKELQLLLNDGTFDKRKFQFPLFPILKDSVSVTTSDGNITILNDRSDLLAVSYEDLNLYAYVEYENGILEFGAEPTKITTVLASFKTVPRMTTYHGLIKRLLDDESLNSDLIDKAMLSGMNSEGVPVSYGRVIHAFQSGIVRNLGYLPTRALAVNDDYVYMGIGGYLVRWDEEQFIVCGNVGSDYTIIRLELSSDGTVFGIVKPNVQDAYSRIFKYDGGSLSYLTDSVACYIDWDDDNIEYAEGAQWKGFSVDDDNSCVWFLCKDGVPLGLGKVGFDGTGYTLYSRSVYRVKGMDFADSGDYIEFFYEYSSGGNEYVRYETFNKSSETWTTRGNLSEIGGDHEATREYIPCDMVYNPTDDMIYFNIIRKQTGAGWRGWFSHVDRGFVTKTIIETYTSLSYKGKYCGGVYLDGFAWYIRGTDKAIGLDYEDGDLVDDADGVLYKLQDGNIFAVSAMAYRPQRKEKAFIREVIAGHSCKMAVRESESAIYAVCSDATINSDPDYGYSLVRYAATWTPIIRMADIQDRNKWDVMSECAKLAAYELGVDRQGRVFFRKRDTDTTTLDSTINGSATTITTDGENMDDFDDEGVIQIDSEIISYTSKTSNSFVECLRGQYDSTPAGHAALSTIYKIDHVFITMQDNKTIKRINSKTPNTDGIYNYIIVPYGIYEAICDYVAAGESWEGCSEQIYGRRELTIDNQFLSDDDVAVAKALAWKCYGLLKDRQSRVEVESVWQPQINLGDSLSIKQPSRTIFDYAISKVKSIQMELGDFFVRCVGKIPQRSVVQEGSGTYHWEEVADQLGSGAVWSMAILDNEIYAGIGTGGPFGGKLHKWDNVNGIWVLQTDGYDDNCQYIYGLAEYNSKIYGVDNAGRLIEYNGSDSWLIKAEKYDAQVDGCRKLKVFKGKLYSLSYNTENVRSYLLEWDGVDSWVSCGYISGTNLYSIESFQNKLYVADYNSKLYEWDGGSTLTEKASDLGIMHAMEVHGGKLYGGNSAGDLLEWNGTDAWIHAATVLSGQEIRSLYSSSDGNLYAGTYAGGTTGGRLFKFVTDHWVQVCATLNDQDGTFELVELNDEIYGGMFANGKLFKKVED